MKRKHASFERLRGMFYGDSGFLEAAVDTLGDCREGVAEKTGFVPAFVLQQKTRRFIPRVDLFEDEAAFHVDIELPGIAAADIRVCVTGKRLTVTGRRNRCPGGGQTVFLEQLEGRFTRTLHLDSAVEAANSRAVLQRGVLRVTLPRVKAGSLKAGELEVPVEEI